MRQHLVKLAPAFLVGGCSLIYNPNNIKPPADSSIDMRPPIDMEIVADADPTMLAFDSVFPTAVYEGVGTGGGRPAVVVLYGHNFAPDAQATLTPMGTANVTILEQHVAHDGNFMMLALQGPIDTMTGEGTDVPITITVTQQSSAGPVVKMIDSAITYHYLDELTDANVGTDSDAVSAKMWSQVELQNAVTFAAGAHGAVKIRSMSSISVATINANAGGAPSPGPGGCAGGGGGGVAGQGSPGLCAGGGGAAGGAGAGAGFVTKGGDGGTNAVGGPMVGDKRITSFMANPASGGGGGAGGVGTGGPGGGGGGVVELTARGDITVAAINANGGAGSGPNGVASAGGGGAGGVILVRAGGTLTGPATLTATKGAAGAAAAGAGSDGRTRYDAAMVAGTVTGTNSYRGPMWTAPDLFATLQTPTLTLSGEALDVGDVRVFTKDGDINDTASANFGTSGNASVMPQLKAGYSKVCVTVMGGQPLPTTPESTNCIEVAFLP
jgi:hypothetical protein